MFFFVPLVAEDAAGRQAHRCPSLDELQARKAAQYPTIRQDFLRSAVSKRA
jgi:hypothetical protein